MALAHLALLALASNSAAPAPSALDQVLKLLGQKRCDDAFELVARVERPNPPTAASLRAARSVAKGAETCREADPVVALAFSGLAMRLAPGDADCALAHAEGLRLVGEGGEAAAVLDAVVSAHPAKKAPRAWMLRARMAHDSGDFDEAVRLLTPLAAEAATKKEATVLLASAQAGLERRKEIASPPRAPDAAEKPLAEPAPRAASHASGQVVATLPGSIGLGGELVLQVRLAQGQAYVFKATGRCDRALRELQDEEGNTMRVKPLDSHGPVFGLDFRVQFGAQASRALHAGVGEDDENRIEFLADAEEQTIRVFDESRADKEVSCSMGAFSVVAQ